MPEVEYSNSKAIYHTDKIKLLQESKQITPTEIQVDLEAYCNDNCSFCSYRKEDGYNNTMLKMIQATPGESYHENRPTGKPSPDSRIPLDFAKKLPLQMVEAGIKAIEITGGGEPTLWPAFDELLENLGKQNRQIGLVTNGSLLSECRIMLICKTCTWVRISMDSASPKMHKLIHRTANEDFDRRIRAIKKIAELKSQEMVLGISFIVTPDNYGDIGDAARLYSKIVGVNHIRFSWMYDKEGHGGLSQQQIDELLELLDVLRGELDRSDYHIFNERDRIDLYSRPNTDFDTCYFQRFVYAIGADCNVYPCCIMKYHPDYANGNIKEMTLKQIIQSQAVDSKMANLDVSKCFPCWLRNRNKSIASAVEKPVHANFI